MTVQNIYERDLAKTAANFEALTPISFLGRAERVYPDYPALIHGSLSQSWGETARRCRQLASALRLRGIGEGDTVSIVAPNIPAMFEAHFGVPMSGAVLNTINTRLDAESMAFIFQHAQSKVVLVDREFGPVVRKALDLLESQPLVIAIDDPLYREGRLSVTSTMRPLLPLVTAMNPAGCRKMSGRPSPLTTPPALPAIPRGWSITIAAHTSTPSTTCSPGSCPNIPSTYGPCRCFTATAGASPGRWRPPPG